jgi:hypothetical protein
MSIASGPKIATDGLRFAYDMDNPMSFKGAVATNQFAVPTPAANGDVTFEVQGTGIFQRIYSGTYDGYTITNNDVVYQYNLTNAAGCYFHGNDVTITAGQWATFTFDYYISPGAADYPVTNYLANFEGVVSAAAADPTPSIMGVWKTATFTAQAGSTGLCRMLLYPGACNGTSLANSGFILYKNPQVIFTSTSNNTAPFVGPFGSRSSTQALEDLTEINSVTINSLTYNSTGTSFTFNGSTDFISTNLVGTTASFTHEVFLSSSNISKDQMYIGYSPIPAHYVRIVNSQAFLSVLTTGGQRTFTNPQVLLNNTTYHIVSCYNGVQLKIYVNGALSAGSVLNEPLAGWGIDRIGRWQDGDQRSFVGTIFSLNTYNRELTAEEVTQNFNALRGRYGI